MRDKELSLKWMRRAKSNLFRAKNEGASKEILLEDMVFDCQQCVEKSLKAICIIIDVEFPFTHNIALLFEVLQKNNIELPTYAKDGMKLTAYAVQTRYPGNYAPVEKEEYDEAFKTTEKIYNWAKSYIESLIQNQEIND